jgi:flagellar FliL protein
MAEEKKGADKGAKAEKPHGGGNKLMLVVIILLVLLVAGVGGVGYMVFASRAQAAGPQAPAEKHHAKKSDAPPVFSKLDTFVVNLSGTGGTLLQVDMQAELADAEAQKKLTDYMPKVRSAIILLLSAKTPDELATPEGKLKLKSQVKQVINGSLVNNSDDEPVTNVVFTSFIIQNP